MDKQTLLHATIAAIGITLKRLAQTLSDTPIDDATREHAIDEAITAEIGAALIATSFARELGWDADALLRRKEHIMDKIEKADGKLTISDFDVIDFLNQRDNANNN